MCARRPPQPNKTNTTMYPLLAEITGNIASAFGLLGAAIGVGLTRTLMMNPGKSTSIVQGVGHALPVQRWSRCDHCRSRERCAVVKDAA